MSDEVKGTPEPTEEEVTTPESTDEQPESTEEAPKEDDGSKQIEAQLEKEKEAVKDPKDQTIADLSYKLRKKKRDDGDDSEDEPEDIPEGDKPVTHKELHAYMAKERTNEIEDIVSEMSDNDKERELIVLTHKNRTYPSTLTLKQQLQEAFLTANKAKILGENQELKRALTGKKSASTDASSAHQDSPKGNQPKLPAADSAELARQGWKWNGTTRRHEKIMPRGTLIRHKDGSTEFVRA